jgi:hypothetical protein
VGLLILDEVHLLGVERGAVLEVIVSRIRLMSQQKNLLTGFGANGKGNGNGNGKGKDKDEGEVGTDVRIIGLSTALANARDLADWMGIGQVGVYNFQPSVRPVPMSIFIQGFPGKHYCPRMATMNKPCYAAILEHSPAKPTLIFVSSRRQTRLTALDLISYCAADDNPRRFNSMSEEQTELVAAGLKDSALRNTIAFGVGIHHAGLEAGDRSTVERLFLEGSIQVLVATSTLAWGVNLPCHLVIVKGTEFFDGKTSRYQDFPITDVLQMMGRAGRPQFDDHAVAVVMAHEPKKHFYKKFLHSPFPVESSLQLQLHEHISAEVNTGSLNSLLDCVEWLSWTYFFRRLAYNPSYYGLDDHTPEGTRGYILRLLIGVLVQLERKGALVIVTESEDETPPPPPGDATLPKKAGGEAAVAPMPFSTITTALTQTQQSRAQKDKEGEEQTQKDRTHKLVSSALSGTGGSNGQQGQDFLLLPTPPGRIASDYYLNHRTTGHFREKVCSLLQLTAGTGKGQGHWQGQGQEGLCYMLLLILCKSHEYSQLPVRHNEDLLNMQLAQSVPSLPLLAPGELLSVAPQAYESPHAKALLLFLAHIHKLPLPIQDYINDTKSVLEQLPRLLNSLMEVVVLLAGPESQEWPAAAASPSAILQGLASLSAMVTRATPYQAADASRGGPVTITDVQKSAEGGEVTVEMDVGPEEGPRGGGKAGKKRVGGLWVLVVAEAKASTAQSGRQVVLAVRKVASSSSAPRKDGAPPSQSKRRTVKLELGAPAPDSCTVEVLADSHCGAARRKL